MALSELKKATENQLSENNCLSLNRKALEVALMKLLQIGVLAFASPAQRIIIMESHKV